MLLIPDWSIFTLAYIIFFKPALEHQIERKHYTYDIFKGGTTEASG